MALWDYRCYWRNREFILRNRLFKRFQNLVYIVANKHTDMSKNAHIFIFLVSVSVEFKSTNSFFKGFGLFDILPIQYQSPRYMSLWENAKYGAYNL